VQGSEFCSGFGALCGTTVFVEKTTTTTLHVVVVGEIVRNSTDPSYLFPKTISKSLYIARRRQCVCGVSNGELRVTSKLNSERFPASGRFPDPVMTFEQIASELGISRQLAYFHFVSGINKLRHRPSLLQNLRELAAEKAVLRDRRVSSVDDKARFRHEISETHA
jgi:hypothetical protein